MTAALTPTATDEFKEAALEAAVDFVESRGSVSGNLEDSCPHPVQDTDLAVLETVRSPRS